MLFLGMHRRCRFGCWAACTWVCGAGATGAAALLLRGVHRRCCRGARRGAVSGRGPATRYSRLRADHTRAGELRGMRRRGNRRVAGVVHRRQRGRPDSSRHVRSLHRCRRNVLILRGTALFGGRLERETAVAA